MTTLKEVKISNSDIGIPCDHIAVCASTNSNTIIGVIVCHEGLIPHMKRWIGFLIARLDI